MDNPGFDAYDYVNEHITGVDLAVISTNTTKLRRQLTQEASIHRTQVRTSIDECVRSLARARFESQTVRGDIVALAHRMDLLDTVDSSAVSRLRELEMLRLKLLEVAEIFEYACRHGGLPSS